jgi:hypothetical protein
MCYNMSSVNRRGTSCLAPAMPNGRYRLQSGKSPRGPLGAANGRYRHGRSRKGRKHAPGSTRHPDDPRCYQLSMRSTDKPRRAAPRWSGHWPICPPPVTSVLLTFAEETNRYVPSNGAAAVKGDEFAHLRQQANRKIRRFAVCNLSSNESVLPSSRPPAQKARTSVCYRMALRLALQKVANGAQRSQAIANDLDDR